MANYITKIVDSNGNEYTIKDPEAGVAGAYVYINESGNLEISSEPDIPETEVTPATDCKLNLVSKTEIQVKPGTETSGTEVKPCSIQFDIEKAGETANGCEVPFKVCNGALKKAEAKGRVVAAKVNVAEVTFDTQNANKESEKGAFDREEFRMSFRQDRWNIEEGESEATQGPVKVKLRGRSFDIRCHNHGGVALQPAGADSDNKENKVKFESSRKSVIGAESPQYNVAGGDGMEFGTFNNNHSSLFTGTYRFRANAPIYAACRGALVTSETGKTDYPTQTDDFKDILPTEEDTVNWADVINVVRYIKSLPGYQTWLASNKLTVPAAGTDGFDSTNMKHPE